MTDQKLNIKHNLTEFDSPATYNKKALDNQGLIKSGGDRNGVELLIAFWTLIEPIRTT